MPDTLSVLLGVTVLLGGLVVALILLSRWRGMNPPVHPDSPGQRLAVLAHQLMRAEAGHQWGFVVNIFGNPFRPAAEALADAGCNDEAMLGQLRGPGLYVRGCQLLDWPTGKS
jgi:hypothetical protein